MHRLLGGVLMAAVALTIGCAAQGMPRVTPWPPTPVHQENTRVGAVSSTLDATGEAIDQRAPAMIRQPGERQRFARVSVPAGERRAGAENLWLGQDTHGVLADGHPAVSASERDWAGLGRDTAWFMGYQGVAAGVTYLLPESVSQWTAEQKQPSVHRWWANVQHPVWDRDSVYVNYIGHPYFGATYYVRARERGFGIFGAFWYTALLSGLYEFGVEAFFERPSYQDLLVTPVGGVLLGAFLFEPLRERIKSKPERQWYDHLTLTLTDPLGAANSLLERLLGLQAALRVQARPPRLVPPEPGNEWTAQALTWQEASPHRSQGVHIEFTVAGRKPSATRTR